METRDDGRREALTRALEDALAGRWQAAHETAQRLEGDALADWLHAVLHKIEGDTANSRYWYRRTSHGFEDFSDTTTEIEAIRSELSR